MPTGNLIWPGIITDALRYVAVPNEPDAGILVLLDENGSQVTLHLRRTAADRMAKMLAAGAIQAPP
jgi:hypothetical protein